MRTGKFWVRNLSIVLLATAVIASGISAKRVTAANALSGRHYPDGFDEDMFIHYEIATNIGILEIVVSGAENGIMYRLIKDETTYTYQHEPDEYAAIPINMGSGDYELIVGVMIDDTVANVVWKTILSIELECELAPFLNSSKIVNWSEEMPFVETAKRLADESDHPMETALVIGEYISGRFSYDYSVADLPSSYVPDLTAIYEVGTGICYDFAALYAAMCRAVGIPAKLVMGYSSYIEPGYHAWCLVQIDGEWHKFDPVYSIYSGAQFLCASNTIELKHY